MVYYEMIDIPIILTEKNHNDPVLCFSICKDNSGPFMVVEAFDDSVILVDENGIFGKVRRKAFGNLYPCIWKKYRYRRPCDSAAAWFEPWEDSGKVFP